MKREKKKFNWSKLWKRNAVVAAIALFVCAAVYLNWSYGKEAETGKALGQSTMVDGKAGENVSEEANPVEVDSVEPPEPKEDDYFAMARLNRQEARDSALALLQDAAAHEDADETVKKQVNDSIQTMADYTVTEAQIENLVLAKGYTDCVAFIGEDELSLAVCPPEGGLSPADTAKIVDVVNQSSGFSADQIKIIEVS